jgi:tRNA G18 (ribose-2'-O)-methylase SpoU
MTNTHSKIFFSETEVKEIPAGQRPIVITDNFSTPENIGHVIRLAANIGVLKVIVLGEGNLRASKIRKTAGTSFDHILVEFITTEELSAHIPADYTLTALETVEDAENLFTTNLPDKMALILGNEKYGISEELLNMSSKKVFIPMPGPIKSMNVSHAAAACLFCWLKQLKDSI